MLFRRNFSENIVFAIKHPITETIATYCHQCTSTESLQF
uniref:Uncharacterized protein n=1 Tax=Setaria italica TaxID=4555 RepID=K3Z245_SETIT